VRTRGTHCWVPVWDGNGLVVDRLTDSEIRTLSAEHLVLPIGRRRIVGAVLGPGVVEQDLRNQLRHGGRIGRGFQQQLDCGPVYSLIGVHGSY
jgi:hypothetical protein